MCSVAQVCGAVQVCDAVQVCSVVQVGSVVQVCRGRAGQECTGPAAHEWRLLQCVEAYQGVEPAPGLPLLHLPQDQQQQQPRLPCASRRPGGETVQLMLAGACTLQTLSLMVILDHQRSSECWHHSAPNDGVVLCQPHNSRISHLLNKIQALSGLLLETAWLVSGTLIGLPAGYKHCCITPHDDRRLVLLSC